jgi:hypothetical protein
MLFSYVEIPLFLGNFQDQGKYRDRDGEREREREREKKKTLHT